MAGLILRDVNVGGIGVAASGGAPLTKSGARVNFSRGLTALFGGKIKGAALTWKPELIEQSKSYLTNLWETSF